MTKRKQSLVILTEDGKGRMNDWSSLWSSQTELMLTYTNTHTLAHTTHTVCCTHFRLSETEKTQQCSASHLISPTSVLSHPESCFQLHLRREIRTNAGHFSHLHAVATFSTDRARCWGKTHLFDIVACLGTGLDKHHTQLLGPLLAFLNRDLPVKRLKIFIHEFYNILLHCDDPCWKTTNFQSGFVMVWILDQPSHADHQQKISLDDTAG